MKKTNISVIGLGSMGLALAKTLLKSDSKISVWNRTLSKSQDLNNKGAHVCLSPIEALQCSEIIIVCLSNYEAWKNIIDSNQIDIDLSKKTIVQLTSGSIEEVTDHSDWVKKHNGDLLEGAIISFPSEIGTKDSSIILAGNNEVIENCKDIISLLFPLHTNLGDNLIGPTVLSRALVSGGLAGLIGMMNGVAICQKADISLDHFKNIYIERINSMINKESKRIIEAIAAKDNITAIKIKSARMLLAHGFLKKVFEVFEKYETSIDMITTSEIAVSLTIDNDRNLEFVTKGENNAIIIYQIN